MIIECATKSATTLLFEINILQRVAFYITLVARNCVHDGIYMVREYSVAPTIDQ
jgi:hypothetical protein